MGTHDRPQRFADDIIIAEAVPDDAAAIAHVLLLAFEEFRPLYTAEAFRATTPDATGVGARLREGTTWLARKRGIVVGSASAVPEQDGLYIRGMAVVPAARQFGIARQLLAIIEKFARDRQYPRMTLSTTPFLTGAIRLYEELGFRRSADGPADLFGTPLFTMIKPLVAGESVIKPGRERSEP